MLKLKRAIVNWNGYASLENSLFDYLDAVLGALRLNNPSIKIEFNFWYCGPETQLNMLPVMKEVDKVVIDQVASHDNGFNNFPQIFSNVKRLTVEAFLHEFPILPNLSNLRYIKVHHIDFLVANQELSLPTVTQFVYVHGCVEGVHKLLTVLPRLFPNLQILDAYYFGNDEAVDKELRVPASCTTVQTTSEVVGMFTGCEGIKNLASDFLHPGKTIKRILDMSSNFETLVLVFSGNLEETINGLVLDILLRFKLLKFLQISINRSDMEDICDCCEKRMSIWMSKLGQLLQSHPIKLLVVNGSEDVQIVYQKQTLTRMEIEEYSTLSDQYEGEFGGHKFVLTWPTRNYHGVEISF